MKTAVRLDDALGRIGRSCDEAESGHELFERLSADLHALVPHDGAIWFGADPVTLLATSPVRVEHMDPSGCSLFWHNEFCVPDTALFTDLARSPDPTASLQRAVAGSPKRSARYRDLLQPDGYADELRSVLRVGTSTWGLLGLYRSVGRAPFDEADLAIVRAASPMIATALRTHVRAASPWLGPARAPGVVIFDQDSRVLSANDDAAGWLCELLPVELLEPMPTSPVELLEQLRVRDDVISQISPVWALLHRARAVGRGMDDQPARLRLRDRRGRWLVLHGSSLTAGDGGEAIAVVIEPAKSSEIAPIIIEAYSLTPRERDVVGALARGETTAEVAARLFLSPHTVRDHIKTVFEKVGVSSRTELVAKLFAEHYDAPAHADMVHVH